VILTNRVRTSPIATPTTVPKLRLTIVARPAIRTSIQPPAKVRVKTSRPSESVPNRWWIDGATFGSALSSWVP
jgi:hypothetical protein